MEVMNGGLAYRIGILAVMTVSMFMHPAVTLMAGDNEAIGTQFRGPGGDTSGQFPIDLSQSGIIEWEVSLPGEGLSSPVLADGKVFLTASSGPDQKKLHVLAFSQDSGELIWERKMMATGRTMCHEKTAVAAPTPVIGDGVIVALYSSNDLICLDLDGNLKWLRGLTLDYPNASNSLGMSSSPVIANGAVVVQVENDSESFAAGIDLRTGKNLWKIDRPKAANWTSPLVIPHGDGKAVALQASTGLTVVDPLSGQSLWSFGGGASTIPSSVVHNNILYVPSNGVTAISLGGDKPAGETIWNSRRLRPSTPSPVVTPSGVFTVNNAGVLTCGSLEDGRRKWELRLQGPFSATPLVSGPFMLFASEKGILQVVRVSPDEGVIQSSLDLGQTILCTPVAHVGQLFLRSDSTLWKLASPIVL